MWNLVFSLRTFGGSLANARFVVNVVGDLGPEEAQTIARLGAELRRVAPVDPRNPLANKLRALDVDPGDGAVLAILDCDTVVVGDVAPYVMGTGIAAKPADFDFLTAREWTRLFRYFGLSSPSRVLRATASGRRMHPYFNTGVILVPAKDRVGLRDSWADWFRRLQELLVVNPDFLPSGLHWTAEQLAFALALLEDVPSRALPPATNYPTHVKSRLGANASPVILHYHGCLDRAGFLHLPKDRIAAVGVAAFNRARTQATGEDPEDGPSAALYLARLRARRAWARMGFARDRARYAVMRHRSRDGPR